MPSTDDDFFAYLAIRLPDERPLPTFAFGRKSYVDGIRESWNPNADPVADQAETTSEETEFTHQSALTEALKASVDFGLAQHELIQAAAITPVVIKMSMVRWGLIDKIEKEAKLVSVDGTSKIIGMNETQYADFAESYDKYSMAKKGLNRLPSAIFLSLVATFDTLVVDILSKMLKLQSDWLDRSERTVSLSRLAAATCLDELIHEQISEEIYQFSRGSHSEQASYIKKTFGIDIASNWKRWPDYIEIFERRNLIAHGEENFNSRYVRICTEAGHKGSEKILGDEVELRDGYIKQSLDILVEFAVLLSFSLFRKFVKENEDQAFTNINEAVYTLIQKGHYTVSERLSDFALSLQKTKITAETRMMLTVNKASAIMHDGRVEDAKKTLDSEDWSAASDLFKICVAAVSGDEATFSSLLPRLKASGAISNQAILTWPCFSLMRKDNSAQIAIKEHFSIDLSKESGESEYPSIEPTEEAVEDRTTH